MRKVLLFLSFALVVSCSDLVNKPQNLVDEDTMAKLIAEFAINDQLGALNQKGSMEESSKYILSQYKVSGKAFTESYTYYTSKPQKLERIYNKAQESLMDRNPEAKKFIKEKLEKNKIPSLETAAER